MKYLHLCMLGSYTWSSCFRKFWCCRCCLKQVMCCFARCCRILCFWIIINVYLSVKFGLFLERKRVNFVLYWPCVDCCPLYWCHWSYLHVLLMFWNCYLYLAPFSSLIRSVIINFCIWIPKKLVGAGFSEACKFMRCSYTLSSSFR